VHHAQIDRLWWKWQHRKPNGRIRDYDAINKDLKSLGKVGLVEMLPPVSLWDTLGLYGLGEDKRVKDVMSTETSLLCYKYPAA
jgi:tyrosinase